MSVWTDAAAIVTAAAAVAVAGAGYVQFVLKRSQLPAADFDVEFTPHVLGPEHLVGEVEAVVRNVGPTMLIATNVKCRVRYRLVDDADVVFSEEPTEPAFPHRGGVAGWRYVRRPAAVAPSVADALGEEAAASTSADNWFPLVSSRTFIQPGVVQRYRKPIALPAMTQLVHVWGSFDYHIQLGAVTKFLSSWLARPPKGQLVFVEGRPEPELDLDWRQGFQNQTVRRTFSVTPPVNGGEKPGGPVLVERFGAALADAADDSSATDNKGDR